MVESLPPKNAHLTPIFTSIGMRRVLLVAAFTPGLPLVYCHWSNTEVARRNVAILKEELGQPGISTDRKEWLRRQISRQVAFLEERSVLYQMTTFPPELELES